MSQTDENTTKPEKYLQKIGESVLTKWLEENYDIGVAKIIAIPKGVIGDSYVIEDLNGKKYFLKIHLLSKLHIDNPRGLGSTLELTFLVTTQVVRQCQALNNHHFIENVPYPIKRQDGKLEGEFGEYSVVLMNYIDGNTPEITKNFVIKIATLIARIHQVDKSKVNLPVEPFDLSYANELRKYLLVLEQSLNLNKNRQKLRDLLLPERLLLNKYIDRLNELCDKVRNNQNNLVITRGDLIPDNFMSDSSENAFIVDWDGAKFTPAERDAWFFMGEFRNDFLKTYKKHNPNAKIDIDLLCFYMYKRYIEDIVYWANEILYENLDKTQVEGNLDGIKVCCLEELQNIEKKVENMKSAINDLP
ncbi:MAG: aminoglycoside phosphotransferase family protein [bacterium]